VWTTYPAVATIIEPRFLASLSREQIIDGLGEIIKLGLVKDRSILTLLKKVHVDTLVASTQLLPLLKKAIAAKAFYVKADPSEVGLRKILNAGHTIGHALELKYKIPHGRAVLIGLRKELSVCEELGLTPPAVRAQYEALLHSLGIHLEDNLAIDWQSVLHDKKVAGDHIVLPVIKKPGEAKLVSIKLASLKHHLVTS